MIGTAIAVKAQRKDGYKKFIEDKNMVIKQKLAYRIVIFLNEGLFNSLIWFLFAIFQVLGGIEVAYNHQILKVSEVQITNCTKEYA